MSYGLSGVYLEWSEFLDRPVIDKLMNAFGGQELKISENPRPDSKLARVIGVENIQKIADNWGTGIVRLPMGAKRRDIRVQALLREGKLTHMEIATAVAVSLRTVQYHAARLRNPEPRSQNNCCIRNIIL